MNEYDRLYRQAQRYKELYPKGTSILLLHMGNDPRPVEDDMRGTVMFVDDMSTIHCKFDNGRQLWQKYVLSKKSVKPQSSFT